MSAAKRATTGLNAWIFVLSVAGALICLNILAAELPVRWDLTAEKRFTLSEATKRLVSGLDHELLIKGYFSPDLQPPFHNLEREIRDILDEYQAASHGKVRVEIANPEGDKELEDEAAGFGIHPVRSDYMGQTKVELRMVFKGVALVYADRQEVLSDLGPDENLEYRLTDAIKKVTATEDKKKTIGFLAGHGELIDMQGVTQAFQELFGDRYGVQAVRADSGPIADDVEALIVLNPTQMVGERAKFEIDQFLMKGKPVAFLLSTIAQDRRFPIGRANPVITTLEGLVDHYGVQLKREVILDQQNSTQMLMATPQGILIVNNPLAMMTQNINREAVMVKDLPAMSLPFSSPVEVKEELSRQAKEGKTDVQVLISSEGTARARGQVTEIMPGPESDLEKALPGDRTGPFPIAVTVVGPFGSAFEGKSIPPAQPAPPSQMGEPPPPPADDAGRQIIPKVDKSRIFVMGNGEFLISRNRLQRASILLLQNLIDWLVQDEDLIAIRSKGGMRPLEPMEAGTAAIYKYGNILGIPLLFVLYGIVRWRLRRKARHDQIFQIRGGILAAAASTARKEA
ncbi:MAG: hypothetical protein FJ125_00650 [Deltaproteobacteria bacterium]|nr:hypothetical protein [Deltaproteobacteria bacterium]